MLEYNLIQILDILDIPDILDIFHKSQLNKCQSRNKSNGTTPLTGFTIFKDMLIHEPLSEQRPLSNKDVKYH